MTGKRARSKSEPEPKAKAKARVKASAAKATSAPDAKSHPSEVPWPSGFQYTDPSDEYMGDIGVPKIKGKGRGRSVLPKPAPPPPKAHAKLSTALFAVPPPPTTKHRSKPLVPPPPALGPGGKAKARAKAVPDAVPKTAAAKARAAAAAENFPVSKARASAKATGPASTDAPGSEPALSSRGRRAVQSARYSSSYSAIAYLPVAHLTEWLRSIDPQFFTLVLINRIMHDRNLIYAYIYLCTGLQPSDRLPSYDRLQCLEAVKAEHERLGRPLRMYAGYNPEDIADIASRVIESGEPLDYVGPEDDDDQPEPEYEDAAAGAEDTTAAAAEEGETEEVPPEPTDPAAAAVAPPAGGPRGVAISYVCYRNEHGDWILSSFNEDDDLVQECMLPEISTGRWSILTSAVDRPHEAHVWNAESGSPPINCQEYMQQHVSSSAAAPAPLVPLVARSRSIRSERPSRPSPSVTSKGAQIVRRAPSQESVALFGGKGKSQESKAAGKGVTGGKSRGTLRTPPPGISVNPKMMPGMVPGTIPARPSPAEQPPAKKPCFGGTIRGPPVPEEPPAPGGDLEVEADDFTPTSPLEVENPEIDPPVVFHDPDGSWQLQFMGRSIELPEPSKRGTGSWTSQQSEAGEWVITDGRHAKICHNLITLRRARVIADLPEHADRPSTPARSLAKQPSAAKSPASLPKPSPVAKSPAAVLPHPPVDLKPLEGVGAVVGGGDGGEPPDGSDLPGITNPENDMEDMEEEQLEEDSLVKDLGELAEAATAADTPTAAAAAEETAAVPSSLPPAASGPAAD